MTIKV